MAAFFLACAVLGGSVLVLQLVLGLVGAGLDHDLDHPHDAADGFNLLTVRGLAAAAAFFGVAGRGALAAGLGVVPSTLLALAAGGVAAFATAGLMRAMRGLESDGALRLEGAIGQPARVHVRLPAEPDSPGKVILTLQDRLVELPAVSLDGELPTGTPVTVVGLAGRDTVEVVRTPEPGV
ncbi:MAG TPA: hypothetical protein VGE02_14135 [Gemmatimonadales bacterium]